MKKIKKLFVTCTMRSGNSLLVSLLSSNKNYLLLNERLHFFRFIFNYYNPLSIKKIDDILFDLNLRLKYRHYFQINRSHLRKKIKSELTYKNIYQNLMNYFSKMANKKFWGESSPMNWRSIPHFLDMFDDGCVIHLVRDPRAVFSSWKKLSSIPNYAYLNCIFNWLDSANHISEYKKRFNKKKYIYLKYEDLMKDPKKHTKAICKFINLEFSDYMLKKSNWTKNNNKLVSIPRSAHEGDNILGFSKKRIDNWKNELEEWEIQLIEHILHKQMKRLGYKTVLPKNKILKLNKAILSKINKNSLLKKNYQNFKKYNIGSPYYPKDPKDFRSWGATGNDSKWFSKTQDGRNYLKERKIYYNKS